MVLLAHFLRQGIAVLRTGMADFPGIIFSSTDTSIRLSESVRLSIIR